MSFVIVKNVCKLLNHNISFYFFYLQFVSEIHVLPQVHMINGNSPPLYTPSFPVSPNFHKSNKFNRKDTHKGKDNFLEKAAKLKTKRPLVQLLNRADSDIGKALDKYMKKAEVTRVTEVVEKQSNSVPVGKLGPVLDNEVPLMKESFPIPMLKSELQPLGPGPYRFCYEPSVVICGARLPWGHVPGMSDWCENNCDKEAYTRHCDDARCTCKCLKPGELF